MSIYKGTTLLSGVATNTIENAHSLFDFIWSDHIKNELPWLRADTFSWQSGAVYVAAYNHLVADASGGTSKTETVGSYTITYTLATDGHKITTDETTVANIYNESGVAWYYVLDTTNQRFKLPRTKYGFTGLRDAVGKYVPESLPNISGYMNLIRGSFRDFSGALYQRDTGTIYFANNQTESDTSSIGFDASRSSSTYQDNAPVQQRATQMYLYFYVGQFSQSATEQTAGLNSELFNGKADTDLSNISANIDYVVESYQNGTNWYRLYKSGWLEQGGYTSSASATIILLKQFADTNYQVLATILTSSPSTSYYATKVSGKTTSQFVLTGNTIGGMWEAKGMST